jgi:hypothetical protein
MLVNSLDNLSQLLLYLLVESLLVLANFKFLTRHFLRGKAQIAQHITHDKHNELTDAAVNRLTVRIALFNAAYQLNKTLNSGHLLSGHRLQIHLLASALQILVKFFNIVLDGLASLFKELLIRSVEDIGPAGPLVDHDELLLAEIEKLEGACHPFTF